jgi:tetratricopeptide (TPR) repeat protein
LAVFFSRWLLGFLFRFPFFADLFVSLQQYSEDLSSLVMTLPLALGLILYFRYLFGFFMRNFERQADLYALRALGSPAPLIRSLEKIAYASGQSRDLPSWHHFSIAERVHFLSLAARFPRWIAAHDRKVYATVTLFFSLLLGLGLYGVRERIWLYSGPADDPRALETLLRRELRAKPGETQTLLALAILYHEGKRLTQAKEAYEKVLAQDPENPLALNNLAWLLATAKEPDLFQPQKALELAQKAAALKPEPMILDTLAEAYLANGRPDKALEVIRRALAQHPSNRGYYLSQEERFQKALKEKP